MTTVDDTFPVPIYPDLAGKVAVITGGSQGIGLATARMLTANGARVVMVGRSQDPLSDAVESVRSDGGDAIGVVGDASSSEDLGRIRVEAEEHFGPVEVLIAYAGGFSSFTPLWETSVAEWRDVVDSNLTSTFLTLGEFVPGMKERRQGSIVTMASISGRFLDKLVTASYAAAKAGVVMLTRHAALELGPHGIRVNALAPGTIATERIERIMDQSSLTATAKLSPLGRLGSPEDCAAATLFLASASSGWITGITLDVAGGRVML